MNPFPKVFTIGQSYIKHLFNEEVDISEKLDGSQIGFGLVDGGLFCRSKGATINVLDPPDIFKPAVNHIKNMKLPEGVFFYGEAFKKPKHHTLAYDKVPHNHIALFCVVLDGDYYFDGPYLKSWAMDLDIDYVRTLYKGKVESAELFDELLKRKSALGGSNIEGFVAKRDEPLVVGNQVYPIMSGKYVSERFKEVHRKTWNSKNTGKGKWERFKDSYRTTQRWEKTIQHLRERGELEESPRDIGKLLKEVKEDISKECEEDIKDFLWRVFGKELLRGSTKGLPEWYKDKLLKDSLDDQF